MTGPLPVLEKLAAWRKQWEMLWHVWKSLADLITTLVKYTQSLIRGVAHYRYTFIM